LFVDIDCGVFALTPIASAEKQYAGDFEEFKKSVNTLGIQVRNAMRQIGRNTAALVASAEQLNQLSQQMTANADETGRIGASVQITGGWEGAVHLDSSLTLARMATARFVGTEPEQLSIDQVRDAMSELANMSAVMIKNLLPGPSYLPLPLVADGAEYNFTICKSNAESEVKFECEGEQFAVSRLRRKYGPS
jgi:chemotaxis protein CheX